MEQNVLIFDIWGDYGHFKKIYATTTAVSYAVPPKTTLYGYLGAITGLSKSDNTYLATFAEKKCLIGISIINPIIMKRLGTNLRPNLSRTAENPKPTLTEYVYKPKYRLYVTHKDKVFYEKLKASLQQHSCVYTPSLGPASLVSNFSWVGEAIANRMQTNDFVPIHSVIPRSHFMSMDVKQLSENRNELVEQSMYAVEMNTAREVTERDDVFFDRQGKPDRHPIWAKVTGYYKIGEANVILF